MNALRNPNGNQLGDVLNTVKGFPINYIRNTFPSRPFRWHSFTQLAEEKVFGL
jgi:hypothetical protein